MTTTNNWRDEFDEKFNGPLYEDGGNWSLDEVKDFISLKIEEAKEEAVKQTYETVREWARNAISIHQHIIDTHTTGPFEWHKAHIEAFKDLLDELSPTSDTK